MSSYSYDGKVPVIIHYFSHSGRRGWFGGFWGITWFSKGGGEKKETGRGQSLLT